jgi:molecular chaperone GrpE
MNEVNQMNDNVNDEQLKDEDINAEIIDDLDEENEELQDEIADEVDLNQELIKKVAELENKVALEHANAQNMIRKAKIDTENMVNRKVTSIVESILPALDNFERSFKAAKNIEDETSKNYVKGFEMIYQQLYNALENDGIKAIDAVGKEFDPNLHQSLGSVDSQDFDSGVVVEEVQKGYIFNDKVLRHSLVKISN